MRHRSGTIPVYLVTGFLGAGKTTLIRQLLAQPQFARTALLINELGEIGIDQDVLDNGSGPTAILLENGCICCALNEDLAFTLRDLLIARNKGEVRPFERIVVETTGIADPTPILRVMISDRWLARHVTLHTVLAVVDARAAKSVLAEQDEAIGQVAAADLIVISKSDLAGEDATSDLEADLRLLNPDAPQIRAVQGRLDAAALTDAPLRSLRSLGELGRGGDHHGHGHAPVHAVATASLRFARRLPWPAVADALDRATSRHRGKLLRCKGILGTSDSVRPILIDGVQDAFHPPVLLEGWPGEDTHSRVVMIGRENSAKEALADFSDFIGLAQGEGGGSPRTEAAAL